MSLEFFREWQGRLTFRNFSRDQNCKPEVVSTGPVKTHLVSTCPGPHTVPGGGTEGSGSASWAIGPGEAPRQGRNEQTDATVMFINLEISRMKFPYFSSLAVNFYVIMCIIIINLNTLELYISELNWEAESY